MFWFLKKKKENCKKYLFELNYKWFVQLNWKFYHYDWLQIDWVDNIEMSYELWNKKFTKVFWYLLLN